MKGFGSTPPCVNRLVLGMSAIRKRSHCQEATSWNPERRRGLLLEAAFQEIHRSGFRSADLDAILATAGETKGALCYHFDNKEALGMR
jgi:AcrR family transcriptional regulator